MSLRYRNNSGEETIIAGLTPGGDIEAGAVATRTGTQTFSLSSNQAQQYAITFDSDLPDENYIVTFEFTTDVGDIVATPALQTTSGFKLWIHNVSAASRAGTLKWTATKTYTVQHAQQNAESIATLEAMVPAGAGAGNKLVTASQLTNTTNPIASDVANLKDLIPVGASINNQLATKNETSVDSALSSTSEHAVQNKVVKAAIDAKQDKLTFDNTPTAGSSNPVTSNGIKAAIDATDRSATIDKLDACYYNVRFTGTTIEDDLITLLNTFKTKANGTYYGDFIRVGKNAGTYNLSKYSDATNTFIIGIATSGSQAYSIGVLNNNTPSVLKIVYATTPTVSAVAPFRIIKNNRCAEISTMDGNSVSDAPLTAYTWRTSVRALGTIDSNMGESLYVMAPTVYQSGNNFYNGVARVFYSGRIDFWCTESISGSYIPYLNVTLPITG